MQAMFLLISKLCPHCILFFFVKLFCADVSSGTDRTEIWYTSEVRSNLVTVFIFNQIRLPEPP